jgi:uncharacterized surface protein with fasciclin (FAS1) repeats
MSTRRSLRVVVALAAAGTLAATASACSSSSGADASAKHTAAAGTPSAAASMASDQPFGSACAAVPKSGAGSFDGMAQDPVATAASNNPVLSTLVTAVKKAGLVDTLDSAQNITVFAPTNAAFAKLPKATLAKVLADKALLTKILTYHVVGQRLTPANLAMGSYPTLEKQSLTTAGSGTAYTVDKTAKVVCGNVQTSNANVEIIDTVLMPPTS